MSGCLDGCKDTARYGVDPSGRTSGVGTKSGYGEGS
jgi:hypothetical protein